MTRRTRTIALSLVLASVASSLGAQTAVTIPGTDQFSMKSKGGVEYRIDVWMPPGHDTLPGPFPTFYVLDGNALLATAAESFRNQSLQGDWPHLMIVGVGYPESSPNIFSPAYSVNRTRDYTPTTVKGPGPTAAASGHAAEFLAFLKDELMPTIESRYKGDPNDRGIGGHSLGGLFTSYALLHEPGLFKHYWLGSPSLWWDDHTSWKYIAAAAKASTQPEGRAYLTVGGEEGFMVTDMKAMADSVRRRFPKLQSKAHVYDGESHVTVMSNALNNALKFLYSDYGTPKITLTPAAAATLAGRWRAESGQILILRATGPRLDLTMPFGANTITSAIEAESPDRLFAPTLGAVITAERDGAGKATSLSWNFGGIKSTFERVTTK